MKEVRADDGRTAMRAISLFARRIVGGGEDDPAGGTGKWETRIHTNTSVSSFGASIFATGHAPNKATAISIPEYSFNRTLVM